MFWLKARRTDFKCHKISNVSRRHTNYIDFPQIIRKMWKNFTKTEKKNLKQPKHHQKHFRKYEKKIIKPQNGNSGCEYW